jgi:hypothetical protein
MIFVQKVQDPISESRGGPGHSKCILMSQHFTQPQQLAQQHFRSGFGGNDAAAGPRKQQFWK